jgi:hypothetical protein
MTYRYEPLKAYLSSMSEPVVVMTYDEIEKLLGRKLPNTAYGDSWRQWWANTETHSQALAWLRAGWRVTRPDLTNKRVKFHRQMASPGETNRASGQPLSSAVSASDAAASAEIVVSREHLTPSALRMVEDAAEDSDGNLGLAIAELLNRAATARRRQLLDWFAENAPRSGTSSVELIREDRDAR